MNRGLQIAVSALISAGALWYSLNGVDLETFFSDIARAKLVWLVPLVLFAALSLWLRALRWKLLLSRLGEIDGSQVFHATCIGFMGNMLLPLRAGEVIKAVVVARGGSVGTAAALATVALERLCDMMMLGLFAVVTLLVVPPSEFLQGRAPTIAVGLSLVLLAVVVTIRFSGWLEERVEVLSQRLPSALGRVVWDLGQGFLHSLRGLGDRRVLFPVVAYSALVWLAAVGGFIACALALEISAPLFPLGMAATVIIALAVSVPSAPGFIGVFFVGSEIALTLFGIDKSMGFTFGVLNWLVQLIVIVALGMWSLSRLQLSLGDVRAAADSPSEAA